MSIQKFEQARDLIETSGNGDFEGAKPDSLISKAEAILAVKFPPSYRRFLLEMGCGGINGFEIYGVINDNFEKSSVPNGIWLTLNERRNSKLPSAFVLIGDTGDGFYYALDTSSLSENGEAAVVIVSPDGQQVQSVAGSFGEYFLDRVRGVV